MNTYIYMIIISKLDAKSIINLSETCKTTYNLLRRSKQSSVIWNEYYNKIRNEKLDITNIKNSEEIFRLCAVEMFKKLKDVENERYLSEYFCYLTDKQIELYLKSKKYK